jgi:hypothetical protein
MTEFVVVLALFLLTLWFGMGLMSAADDGQSRSAL